MIEMAATSGPSIATDPSPREGRSYRILVCTPFPPRLDARHGGRATAQLLARLAERHEIVLLSLRTPEDLPVDSVFTERCEHVEEVLLSTSPLARSAWSRRLHWALGLARGLPPWAADCRSAQYDERLRALVTEWRPELVELHLQVMAQYARALADVPAARILVDYDPPSAWAAELARGAVGLRRLTSRVELAVWRRYEKATRRRCDAIVVFAERDVPAVEATAPNVHVRRVPLTIEVPDEPLDPLGESPGTVVFVGGFGHPPNVDAARWLAEAIFPRILERVPDARLALVGDRPGDDVLGLAGGRVSVYGSVPDVRPYLDRAAVVVAPIRLGGSMRGKVLEALASGKALVATPRGAEGVEAVPDEHLLLAEREDEFADAVAGLLLDADRRGALAANARAWAVENLSVERSVEGFECLYDELAHPSASVSVAPRTTA